MNKPVAAKDPAERTIVVIAGVNRIEFSKKWLVNLIRQLEALK